MKSELEVSNFTCVFGTHGVTELEAVLAVGGWCQGAWNGSGMMGFRGGWRGRVLGQRWRSGFRIGAGSLEACLERRREGTLFSPGPGLNSKKMRPG